MMVLLDGSNLRPFQIVVGILLLTAAALLFGGERSPNKIVRPIQGFAEHSMESQHVALHA